LLLLDVGGGSTEFILGHGEHKHFRASFPLGTVRLLEQLPPGDPPSGNDLSICRDWIRNFLVTEVRPKVEPALRRETGTRPGAGLLWLVGTGGTTTILARMEGGLEEYDRQRIEATRLSRDRMEYYVSWLWSLPLTQRREIVGLPQNRADVILTGVAIYAAVMEQFGFSELHISTRGLRFAAVMDNS
jgi:exopolyphosphatase/guanosine-5'-triphosphate,3'-diphosphate pyrophosphatase